MDKSRAVTFVQRRLLNPLVRPVLERGIRIPGVRPLADDRRSSYVRNIEADPRVRVRVRGRSGTARTLTDANPHERQRMLGQRLGARINAATVRRLGTDLLTVRIDLDD